VKYKQHWAPFLPGFSGIFLVFFRIVSRIFDISKHFWVRFYPLHPTSYTTARRGCPHQAFGALKVIKIGKQIMNSEICCCEEGQDTTFLIIF